MPHLVIGLPIPPDPNVRNEMGKAAAAFHGQQKNDLGLDMEVKDRRSRNPSY